MTVRDVPPDMEFERDDILGDGCGRGFEEYDVDITEQGPRPRPRRPETAWEKQAATWHGTTHFFECCGTTFGAMNAADLERMKRHHQASQYHRNRQPARAAMVLDQDV